MHSKYFHFKSLLILPASKASIMAGIKQQRGLICIKIGPFAGQKQPWEQHSGENVCHKGVSVAEFQQKDEGDQPQGRERERVRGGYGWWRVLTALHVLKDVLTQSSHSWWSKVKECRRSSFQVPTAQFFFPSNFRITKNLWGQIVLWVLLKLTCKWCLFEREGLKVSSSTSLVQLGSGKYFEVYFVIVLWKMPLCKRLNSKNVSPWFKSEAF